MRNRAGPLLLLAASGCGILGGGKAQCEDACPEGTNLVQVDFEGVIRDGTFVFETDECMAFCEPVVRCDFPNVPVVDDEVFTCQALAGYATIPATADVDTSFGESFRIPDPPTVFPVGEWWSKLAFGDVDGDGLADLVAVTAGDLQVHFGLGDGTFEAPVASGLSVAANDMELGEFTGDGLVDVVTVVNSGEATVYAGDGAGLFAPGLVAGQLGWEVIQAGDLDGDGLDDLFTATGGGVVGFANPGGTFTNVTLSGPWGVQEAPVQVFDADGDGWMDVGYGAEGGSVFFNNGGRSFSAPLTGANGTSDLLQFEVADVDLDGAEEMLLWDPGYQVLTAVNADDGFSTESTIDPSGLNFSAVRFDMDGDGAADAVNADGLLLFTNFGNPYITTRGVGLSSAAAVVDIDGDGLGEGVFASAYDPEIWTVWP